MDFNFGYHYPSGWNTGNYISNVPNGFNQNVPTTIMSPPPGFPQTPITVHHSTGHMQHIQQQHSIGPAQQQQPAPQPPAPPAPLPPPPLPPQTPSQGIQPASQNTPVVVTQAHSFPANTPVVVTQAHSFPAIPGFSNPRIPQSVF